MSFRMSDKFEKYSSHSPLVPVWCITPNITGCIHRFFDTSPMSPSGRYVGLTRFKDESRTPYPGQTAEIIVVDLHTGDTEKVAETNGFDTQLGAQVQWGADDGELFFNDLNTTTWKPFLVKLNPMTGTRKEIDGMMYMLSADGKKAVSPCLLRTGLTQQGYGVYVPSPYIPLNKHAYENDGVYVTDIESGECKLLVSMKEMVEQLRDQISDEEHVGGAFYGFHAKWNPQGTKIMFVIRYRPMQGGDLGKIATHLLTMNADGSNIQMALHSKNRRSGHHPNWCQDGEYITQNLNIVGEDLRFVKFRYDGSGMQELVKNIIGSGHPNLHKN